MTSLDGSVVFPTVADVGHQIETPAVYGYPPGIAYDIFLYAPQNNIMCGVPVPFAVLVPGLALALSLIFT